MQKRIFRSICATVLISVLIFGVAAVLAGYGFYKNEAEAELKTLANLVTCDDYTNEQIIDIIDKSLDYKVRVTQTDLSGRVLFDTDFDASELENHKDRKEIAEAIENGSGSDTRRSETSGATAYYYAVKRGDFIYRFARERSSVMSLFLGLVPVVICVGGIVILIGTVVSMKLSENAIKPIQKIVTNLDVLDESKEIEVEYEELEPIIDAVRRLSSRLARYITRLKNEKEKITLITDNMVEGMILLDEKRNILSVNKSAVSFLNPMFVLKEETNIVELSRNAKLIEAIDRAESGEAESGVISTSDRQLQFFVNKTEAGGEHGFIILLVDATESLKAEEIRKDFSANVSHELKTPLTTIKGFGEMLENGIITDSNAVKKYGGTIYRESERLLQLINDIIRLSEIEEMSADESVTAVNLMKVSEDVCEILQHKADSHGITLSLEGESFEISANPSYMSELILNLIDNSIKYNNEGGHVWVSISRKNGNAYITVKDDGIGISKEHQDRIFERFYRVDKSRSKQTGGTGLGLSIVKHIASYHHGSVSLESEEGKGTKIVVSIPQNRFTRAD